MTIKPINLAPVTLVFLNVLKEEGLDIEFCSQMYRPLLLALAGILLEPISSVSKRVMPARSTWALYGFETIIWSKKDAWLTAQGPRVTARWIMVEKVSPIEFARALRDSALLLDRVPHSPLWKRFANHGPDYRRSRICWRNFCPADSLLKDFRPLAGCRSRHRRRGAWLPALTHGQGLLDDGRKSAYAARGQKLAAAHLAMVEQSKPMRH